MNGCFPLQIQGLRHLLEAITTRGYSSARELAPRVSNQGIVTELRMAFLAGKHESRYCTKNGAAAVEQNGPFVSTRPLVL